jgi:hypothetical protein
MITVDHPLIQLLALIDMVWVEAEGFKGMRGAPKVYSEKTMFKVYVVSLLKQLWAHRSVWRYLSSMPLVTSACGLARIPDRRTLDRRLEEIAPQAEGQIQALGLTLSLEAVTDATIAASDGSAFATPGPVWHKKDKQGHPPGRVAWRGCKPIGFNRRIMAGSTATRPMSRSVSHQRPSASFWVPV